MSSVFSGSKSSKNKVPNIFSKIKQGIKEKQQQLGKKNIINYEENKEAVYNIGEDSDEEEKKQQIQNQENLDESQGEVMSDSSDDEEEEKKDENILDKPIYVKKPGNTTGDMLDAADSEEKSNSEESSSSDESSSSEEEQDEEQVNQQQQIDKDKLKMTFERPLLARCVNKLPKRGQLVNLNQYEVYYALRKVPKPITRLPYAAHQTREEMLAELKGDSSTVMTNNSDGSNSSGTSSQSTPVFSSKKSLFKKLVVDKFNAKFNSKTQETQTLQKNHVRFITFDQGRILVLKKLRDPLDGDSYSETRQFPNFNRSIDDKKYSLPLITWNAKIVRVYKVEDLRGVRLKNAKHIQQMREIAGKASVEQKNEILNNLEALVCLQFSNQVNPSDNAVPNDPLQFQKDPSQFDKTVYLHKLVKSYTPKQFQNETQFKNMQEIDFCYHLLIRDVDEFLQEIDMERAKKVGCTLEPLRLNTSQKNS